MKLMMGSASVPFVGVSSQPNVFHLHKKIADLPARRHSSTRYVFQSKLVFCNFSCFPCTTESKSILILRTRSFCSAVVAIRALLQSRGFRCPFHEIRRQGLLAWRESTSPCIRAHGSMSLGYVGK